MALLEPGQLVQEEGEEHQLALNAWHQPHFDLCVPFLLGRASYQMVFMSEKEFAKFKLQKRFNITRKAGKYVASRIFRSYEIHLYQVEKFYVEIWQKVGLNLVHFVEVLKNEQALDEYLGSWKGVIGNLKNGE